MIELEQSSAYFQVKEKLSGKSYLSVRRLFRRLSMSAITSHGAALAAATAAAFSAPLVADEFSHYQSHYGQQD